MWEKIFELLMEKPDLEWMMVDASHVHFTESH